MALWTIRQNCRRITCSAAEYMRVRIRYENTIDDLVALARFHNDHSPAARRVRLRATWIFALAVLAVTAGLTIKMSVAMEGRGLEGQVFIAVMVAVLLTSLLIALIRMPGGFRRQAERLARRMYAEGSNKSVLGSHELEIVGSELVSRSTYGESRLRVEVVDRVVTCAGYTFIYVNAVTAYVIPHEAVSEGDPRAFGEAINQRIAPRQTIPGAVADGGDVWAFPMCRLLSPAAPELYRSAASTGGQRCPKVPTELDGLSFSPFS